VILIPALRTQVELSIANQLRLGRSFREAVDEAYALAVRKGRREGWSRDLEVLLASAFAEVAVGLADEVARSVVSVSALG
jgi:hypothetical protein